LAAIGGSFSRRAKLRLIFAAIDDPLGAEKASTQDMPAVLSA
jgi:hypothetical protein